MSHDLTAEYDGYANELRTVVDDPERAAEVRAAMARVRAGIEAQAAAKMAEAEGHEGQGRDMLAARARIRARELREHLETTAQSLPMEQAASRKKGA